MIKNDFVAAMTNEQLLEGETGHSKARSSRRLAMAAGLTKSSDELKQAWTRNPEAYITTLKGAIAAYEDNKNLEELLIGCLARLVCIVDEEEGISEAVERAMEIVSQSAPTRH